MRQIAKIFFPKDSVGKYLSRNGHLNPVPARELANATGLFLQQVHASPNIYVIEDFLSGQEVDHIMQSKEFRKGFKKSFTDAATHLQNKVDSNRDSSFVWFGKMQTSVIARIERRASQLFGVTADRVEPLQVVKYRPGQFFGRHHDMGVLFDDGSVELPERPPRRLTTIFVYLNDVDPSNGGSTRFPGLVNEDGIPLEVFPKRGKAVVFCNITGEGTPDERTVHEGCPILQGVKYGMNIWTNDKR